MIYCLRIEGWKRGAKLNRGQRLGAASCSTEIIFFVGVVDSIGKRWASFLALFRKWCHEVF
ncbi:hypothetical protein [Rubritalea tangerina]|uniref:hypothetical protein n=1 Tax=Rubritalea tangerina TaxID=430798 RepID=UPI003607CA14